MNNYIITVHAGLCNTIKSMISYYRINDNKNKNIIVYNNKNDYNSMALINNGILPGSLKNLFENVEEKKVIPKNSKIIRTWRIITFKNDNLNDNIYYSYRDKYSNKYGDIDFMYTKIPNNIKESIINNLQKIIIKKDILDEVKIISSKFNDKTISVQINPIRIYTALKNNPNFSSDEMENFMRKKNSFIYDIVNEMKKYDDSYNFYLSISYKPLIDIFFNEFTKERIIYIEHEQTREWYFDMIDLLLLSKNKIIIGTALSTFCEVAWFYSGCKSEIKLIGNYNFIPKELYI